MKITEGYKTFFINILVAAAMTFIVNMSFFLFTGEMHSRRIPMNFPVYYGAVQILYFFVMALATTSVNTIRELKTIFKILLTLAVIMVLYLFTPTVTREGVWVVLLDSNRFMNPRFMTNPLFILVVSILYGKIFELVYQKQHMSIENEQLKNENLQTRYNMLANQISPHFLFNSLNSLSMLVREDEKDKALLYIDKMADTFRYMLQSGRSELTTLSEELQFTEAYLYLHTIRYENKLFCDIDIPARYMSWHLPAMSLLPLIENAVKHNSITLANPLHISIKHNGSALVVSNKMNPKLEPTDGTGIGLKNLSSRYTLLTSHDIKIKNDGQLFQIILPLIK